MIGLAAMLVCYLAGSAVIARLAWEAWHGEPSPNGRARIVCLGVLAAVFWPLGVVFAAVVVGLELLDRRSNLRLP